MSNTMTASAASTIDLRMIMFSSLSLNAMVHGNASDFAIDIDNRLGECKRRFLRQIVPDTARNGPISVLAGEFFWRRQPAPGAARRWDRLPS